MNKRFFEILSSLSEAFGPTGCEDRVQNLIKREIESYGTCSTDPMGNLILHIEGPGEKVMVTTAVDEAGFMITDMDDKGYLRVESTGSGDGSCFIGKLFTVGNERECVTAIGGGNVLHLLEGSQRTDVPSFKRMYLDCHFESKEEAEQHFRKGDFAAFKGYETERFPHGYIVGKALDARANAAILIHAIQQLHSDKDLYFVFSVKEKAGLSSAVHACYNLKPDKAVILDYSMANDLPYVKKEEYGSSSLGSGVAIALKDKRALYYDSPFFKEVVKKAKEQEIPFVLTDEMPLGSDANGFLHLTGKGTPTVRLCLPCRNPETQNCIMKEEDLEASLSLLLALLNNEQ